MRSRTTPALGAPPARHGLRSRAGRQAVLVGAVGQLVAAVASRPGVGQPGGTTTPDLLVTPAGWAFAVWGLVIAGALAYGVYQLPSYRGDLPALQAVAWPLVGAQAAFVVWLVLDATAPSWTTVVAVVVMLALLAVAYDRALRWRRLVPLPGRLLVLGVLGVWTGWSAAVLPVDVASALLDVGLPASGAAAVAWQAVVLAAVCAVGVAVVLLWRARLPSVAAVLWALAGVAAGSAGRGAPLLAGLAAAATLALAVWAARWRWQDLRRRAEAALGVVSRRGPAGGPTLAGEVVDPPERPARAPPGRLIRWRERPPWRSWSPPRWLCWPPPWWARPRPGRPPIPRCATATRTGAWSSPWTVWRPPCGPGRRSRRRPTASPTAPRRRGSRGPCPPWPRAAGGARGPAGRARCWARWPPPRGRQASPACSWPRWPAAARRPAGWRRCWRSR